MMWRGTWPHQWLVIILIPLKPRNQVTSIATNVAQRRVVPSFPASSPFPGPVSSPGGVPLSGGTNRRADDDDVDADATAPALIRTVPLPSPRVNHSFPTTTTVISPRVPASTVPGLAPTVTPLIPRPTTSLIPRIIIIASAAAATIDMPVSIGTAARLIRALAGGAVLVAGTCTCDLPVVDGDGGGGGAAASTTTTNALTTPGPPASIVPPAMPIDDSDDMADGGDSSLLLMMMAASSISSDVGRGCLSCAPRRGCRLASHSRPPPTAVKDEPVKRSRDCPAVLVEPISTATFPRPGHPASLLSSSLPPQLGGRRRRSGRVGGGPRATKVAGTRRVYTSGGRDAVVAARHAAEMINTEVGPHRIRQPMLLMTGGACVGQLSVPARSRDHSCDLSAGEDEPKGDTS